MNHNDKDWLDVYRAAAMEFDRDKLPASIDVAESAKTQSRLPYVLRQFSMVVT